MFSWETKTEKLVHKNIKLLFDENSLIQVMYRPFVKINAYYSQDLNHSLGQLSKIFSANNLNNLVICVTGIGTKKDFSCLITNIIPDLSFEDKSQCFPLYYYEPAKNIQCSLLDNTPSQEQYTRKDGITDWILKTIKGRFGNAQEITKEVIFYYVYGLLHSKDYRTRFNDDLKKSLPRIPIVDKLSDFMKFSEIGKLLADLHLNYETEPAYKEVVVSGSGDYHVDKMRFAGKAYPCPTNQLRRNSSKKAEKKSLKLIYY